MVAGRPVATTTSSLHPAPGQGARCDERDHAPSASHHILSVLVENKAGVLARVAGLFARRGFNIFSLAVAPTEDERFSRITIVVDVESAPLEQIVKQLVQADQRGEDQRARPADVGRARAAAGHRRGRPPTSRGQVIELVHDLRGQDPRRRPRRAHRLARGPPDKLDDFEELLRPYGIVELQRTGRVALPKLEREAARLRAVKGRAS